MFYGVAGYIKLLGDLNVRSEWVSEAISALKIIKCHFKRIDGAQRLRTDRVFKKLKELPSITDCKLNVVDGEIKGIRLTCFGGRKEIEIGKY